MLCCRGKILVSYPVKRHFKSGVNCNPGARAQIYYCVHGRTPRPRALTSSHFRRLSFAGCPTSIVLVALADGACVVTACVMTQIESSIGVIASGKRRLYT